MTLGLVKDWNDIKKAYNKQLADPQFKPDLGKLLGKYEADYDAAEDLTKQIDGMKSGLLPFINSMADSRKETRSQLEDAKKKLVDDFDAQYAAFKNDYGSGSDWDAVEEACNKYLTASKKFLAAVDDCVKQLSQSRDSITKDEQTGISQYLTKRKQLEDTHKKVADDASKVGKQSLQVIASYVKIAKTMDEGELASEINALTFKIQNIAIP